MLVELVLPVSPGYLFGELATDDGGRQLTSTCQFCGVLFKCAASCFGFRSETGDSQ